jgi:hypothetical protein
MEATPGWTREGLPGAGELVYGEDAALEAVWRAVPAPGADALPADPVAILVRGRACMATFLGGASLGIVLVAPRQAIPG